MADAHAVGSRAEALLDRLRQVEPDKPGERTRWYRNPDGPEAAAFIEALAAERDAAIAARDVMAKALVSACADLEAEVRARFGMSNGQVALHPLEQRRYSRELDVIDEYRAALAQAGEDGRG